MATSLVSFLTLAALFCASPVIAADATGQRATSLEEPAAESLGLTALGGVHLPSCVGTGGCESRLDPAPSVRTLVLYQPNARWGVGLAAQVAAVHWTASYIPYTANPTIQTIESDLTAGFWGVAARYSMMPEWPVTPFVELVIGSAFQMQTGSNLNCNSGFIPTSQVGIGGRARVTAEISLFAMASASGALVRTIVLLPTGLRQLRSLRGATVFARAPPSISGSVRRRRVRRPPGADITRG